MSISSASRGRKRRIADLDTSADYSSFDNRGRVATFSRSALDLRSVASLLPYCRGRWPSIARAEQALYLRLEHPAIDRLQLELSGQRRLVSTARTSLETYVVKGLALPAKKLTGALFSSASLNIFSSLTAVLAAYASSFIGFSLNLTLSYYDLRKNGGSPAYESFILASHGLSFLTILIGGFAVYLQRGAGAVAVFTLLTAAVFFLFNTAVSAVFHHFDRRTAARIEERIIEDQHQRALAVLQ